MIDTSIDRELTRYVDGEIDSALGIGVPTFPRADCILANNLNGSQVGFFDDNEEISIPGGAIFMGDSNWKVKFSAIPQSPDEFEMLYGEKNTAGSVSMGIRLDGDRQLIVRAISDQADNLSILSGIFLTTNALYESIEVERDGQNITFRVGGTETTIGGLLGTYTMDEGYVGSAGGQTFYTGIMCCIETPNFTYLLNEGSGNTITDTSGNGNDGTLSNPLSVFWKRYLSKDKAVPGEYTLMHNGPSFTNFGKQVAYFDGSSSFITTSKTCVSTTQDWSFKRKGILSTATINNARFYIEKQVGSFSFFGLARDNVAGDKLSFLFRSEGGDSVSGVVDFSLFDNEYHELEVRWTYSTGILDFYVDGVFIDDFNCSTLKNDVWLADTASFGGRFDDLTGAVGWALEYEQCGEILNFPNGGAPTIIGSEGSIYTVTDDTGDMWDYRLFQNKPIDTSTVLAEINPRGTPSIQAQTGQTTGTTLNQAGVLALDNVDLGDTVFVKPDVSEILTYSSARSGSTKQQILDHQGR